MDLRGFNQSDKPRGISSYKIDAVVADLKAFIERFSMYFSYAIYLNQDLDVNLIRSIRLQIAKNAFSLDTTGER